MGSELEFDGTLADVCEYLEISGVFDEKVGALLNKIKVTNLECDSRRVTKGTIFYARKGQHYNPFEHLEEIKAKGAVAILIDGPELGDLAAIESMALKQPVESSSDDLQVTLQGDTIYNSHTNNDPTNIRQIDVFKALRSSQGMSEEDDQLRRSGRKVILSDVSSPRYAMDSYHATTNTPEAKAISDANLLRLVLPSNRSLSALAGFIYGDPSRKLKLIGVTGTNGKSTITNLIAQMLDLSGHHCAVFGTLGFGFLDELHKSANTTLDAISLQRELARYVAKGADYAVLEVSSIGFCENRVSGLHFYGGGFSNLSQDHLDYHKTMDDYFNSKLAFLRMVPAERLVVNRNSEYGKKIIDQISNVFEVGVENSYFDKRTSHNFLNIKKVNYKHSSLELMLNNGEKGVTRTELNLLGHFNAENYAVALGILLALGFEYKHMASLAPKLKPITGRMECFVTDYKPKMIVDYAHTPDGVEQALKAAQSHMKSRGRIFVVLGCGGDRDRSKRPIMAMKASIFSDYAIFTADNPRSENMYDILEDMMLSILPSPADVKFKQNLASMTDDSLVIDGDASKEDLAKLDQSIAERLDRENSTHRELLLSWRRNSIEEYMSQSLPQVDALFKNVIVIPDREKAIEYAFNQAAAQDCILVAGKGHEDYQILGDKTIHFSDREICCRLLGITLPEDQAKIVIQFDDNTVSLPSAQFAEVSATDSAKQETKKTKSTKANSTKRKSTKSDSDNAETNDDSAVVLESKTDEADKSKIKAKTDESDKSAAEETDKVASTSSRKKASRVKKTKSE